LFFSFYTTHILVFNQPPLSCFLCKVSPTNFSDQSSSDTPPQADDYAFTDRLTGKCFSFPFGADGILVPPTELRAQIMRPLELVKAAKSFFALRSPSHHRLQEEPLLPLGFFSTEYSACVPVRFMLGCMASACQRLVAAPADLHGSHKTTWRFAECVMERVTWGRVRIVLVRLQRHACFAARCVCAFLEPFLAHVVRLTRAAANAGESSGAPPLVAVTSETPPSAARQCFSPVCRLLLPLAFVCEVTSPASSFTKPQNAATCHFFMPG
jgi:hypothetical protein